ncbi:MAG TPA: TonB-dependent receptor plug domain-containing protein [Longimicrobiales bacterium]|nr:TonB-dependent receptor plug domain-containing protein [Longimicrobiales bacterium]
MTSVPAQVRAQQAAEDDSVRVYQLEPLSVVGRYDDLTGVAGSASVGYVGYGDLSARPLLREGELLETVPGMILTQHSGSGKSNQMFVRGFNLDHGTDFSTRLEQIPINFPTHAHGHGYTDLNMLIPELVDHVEYSLGNYYADIGDFSAAGGADIKLRRSLERPLFSVEAGANAHRRVVARASAAMGTRGSLLAGGELRGYDGPWDVPEDLRKVSGMLRYTYEGESSDFSLLALGYDSEWNASDQIPIRAVDGGGIGRFGQIDPTLGGETARYILSGRWTRSTHRSSQRVMVYGQRYDLDLFSNFTYELDDPAAGDQIRQEDDARMTFGADVAHLQALDFGGHEHRIAVGAQARLGWQASHRHADSRRSPPSCPRRPRRAARCRAPPSRGRTWTAGGRAARRGGAQPARRGALGYPVLLYVPSSGRAGGRCGRHPLPPVGAAPAPREPELGTLSDDGGGRPGALAGRITALSCPAAASACAPRPPPPPAA